MITRIVIVIGVKLTRMESKNKAVKNYLRSIRVFEKSRKFDFEDIGLTSLYVAEVGT